MVRPGGGGTGWMPMTNQNPTWDEVLKMIRELENQLLDVRASFASMRVLVFLVVLLMGVCAAIGWLQV